MESGKIYDINWDLQETWFNPLTLKAAKNRPDDLVNILPTEAFSVKHLKEKCWSEVKNLLSFKYFGNFCFIPKLFSKVWE